MADDGDPSDSGGFGIAFDLDDDAVPKKPAAPPPQAAPSAPGYGQPGLPAQPIQPRLPQGMAGQGPPHGQPIPPARSSGPGAFPGGPVGPYPGGPVGPFPGSQNDPGFVPVDMPPGRSFGDQAADVARVAAERGKVVAERMGEAAVVVAGKTRDVAFKAAVSSIGGHAPEKVIRLEDPSTWLKPMRGPLIALGLAILVSLLAVIVGKATGTKLPVGWISGPLLLGAIVFAVIRWMRLQE